ncbi:PAS domain S-box-containing protein/diguanylate cyclase (GGDEF) domain-containing protein [Actinacidiphila yanglinensis]|uniref:PAS domain S-box-containing protein/diguanylate cyclase (GGDEF) domain-containing protein n=1 Tax=Actinacidiphila yanglinensis TaxID=310779 RepID=A0A1H6D2I1_9ACTN|nr:EAL domain-containing protein [Actinacidiphila yanglinensis]SEG79254.1 PAS domain S-box-containing protein/diguanylate cyclase (GGDEF) domain-containing protein [Actinacidiphila yanglinensis]
MGGPAGGPGVEPDSTAATITRSDRMGRSSYAAEPGEHHAAEPGGHRGAEPADYRAAFAVARTGMALLGPDGTVLAANAALARLLGTPLERMVASDARLLLGSARDPHTDAAFDAVVTGRRRRLRCTRHLTRADGTELRAELTLARTDTRPLLLTVEDVGERDALRRELRHLRMHDPVTRLPNRALFFERLAEACERAPERGTGRIGLCYLDLDGFKAINDTLGHRVGDELLAAVAGRLLTCAGPGGHLTARLGGDEFALLLRDSTGTGQATELAEAVLASFQRPFEVAGQRLAVSASIGVVEREAQGTSPTGLMQAADTTLYWAKDDGKGRWTLFDPERNEHRMTRQSLSSTLRQAVERGEFVLDYQPLVALDTGDLRGVEALVRWEHPHFGRLAPNRFIGLAEEDGSIVQLGRWVLAESCRQARAWQEERPGTPLVVSVNVAVRQVWDSDLVADVAAILDETGLPPHLLQLELTESAVMGSAGRPLQALHALHEMGVRIAIDDFGTGYSNLAYMSRLPVSALKLDGSFVQGFRSAEHPNPADETIVEALVDLAHRLGLTVTAECVENADQADRLRRIGCDTGQGWHYSRPVAAASISRLLN